MRKPFQNATVRWAIERFRDTGGAKRVLVADEVGLGKTLIAQGVIEALASERAPEKPLRVFYLCSSLSIAHQNRARLLEILPPEEREKALVNPGRLSLLLDAPEAQTTARFRLYTLTPDTSLRPGTGLALERLALARCVWQAFDYTAHDWFHTAFRVGVGDSEWRQRWEMTPVPLWFTSGFRNRFIERAKEKFPRSDAWSDAIAVRIRAALEDPDQHWQAVARLRSALILTIVGQVAPDLVIFDEFQRFFDVLPTAAGKERDEGASAADADDADSQAREIVDALIRTEGNRAGVLMLSATPYRMYASALERDDHHEEFYKLVSFLFDSMGPAEALKREFESYRDSLQLGPANDSAVRAAKQVIEARLRAVMARTERAALLKGIWPRPKIKDVAARLEPMDFRAFRFLSESTSDRMRSGVEPFWSSVPFPLQMMPASDYVFRNEASPAHLSRGERVVRIRFDTVRAYGKQEYPHPRLRALLDALPAELLTLPWVPPSKPWWALGGAFERARRRGALSKALLFSRFRAVPRAIATLLSYEAERQAIEGSAETKRRRYDYTSRSEHAGGTRELAPSRRGQPELRMLPRRAFATRTAGEWLRAAAMFLPWPTLARLGDPLQHAIESRGEVTHSEAIARVTDALRERFPGAKNTGRPIRAWRWILKLEEQESATWTELEHGLRTWRELPENAPVLRPAPLEAEAPSDAELAELADIAVCGPGPVLLRCVRRIFGPCSQLRARIAQLCAVSVGGLASYLDAPELHLLIADGGRRDRRAALRRAVWQGNLEAVLDEHFATEQGLGTTEPSTAREVAALESLLEALTLRDSSLLVDRLSGREGHVMRLRCHAAVAFGVRARAERDAEAPRNDQLRVAFNTPFRPMVLVTTSIGQEGLDFHRWANHLVHWDLPDSPVDLEQRDGRLNRHGSLAVRLALAERVDLTQLDAARSPWHVIAQHARTLEDAHGLQPWWFTPGAEIRRTLFVPPFSELSRVRDRLQLDLDYYRLALGQPDQEALVRRLQAAVTQDQSGADWYAWLREVAIDLRPAIEIASRGRVRLVGDDGEAVGHVAPQP